MNVEFFPKWLCSIFSSLLNVKISTTFIFRTVAPRWGRVCRRVITSTYPTPAEIIVAVHRWGKVKRVPFPKICHAYPTMMKLGTVLPYLKKIQEIYESCNTLLELSSADISIVHRKSANFAISRNADIDCILVHNF